MSISTTWDNEARTTLHHSFDGQWTWDDVLKSWMTVYTMIQGSPHTIDAIIDIAGTAGWLAYDARLVKQLGECPVPDNVGLVIVVGANVFVQSLWNIYGQLFPAPAQKLNLRFMSTVDEARGAIADHHRGDAPA